MQSRAKRIADALQKDYWFKGGRPITAAEKRKRLPTDKPAPVPVAWPQLSVIRMNSTYLECTNYLFGEKGFLTIVSLTFLSMIGVFLLSLISVTAGRWLELTGSESVEEILFLGFMFLIFAPIIALLIFGLTYECFTLTHFPMRFNRKTRMVHVFLESEKGRILSIPWDNVYFTCSSLGGLKMFGGGAHTVVGFKMSEDGETVLEAFELATRDEWDSEHRFLQWEFVRQYMEGDEETLQELADMVHEVQDVAERRETLYGSFRRKLAHYTRGHLSLIIIAFPLVLLFTLGRQIAMWTCKIPRWPDEIEAECQYPANDPILRDAQHLTPIENRIFLDISGHRWQ
jgi:hypothetical protein